ncbi:hypothetical protein [Proteus mirabilis]|uniref:hypothetical protein n=1 Tax=Proteus mirabilis TaxID=584 RepID=UPI00254ED74C|nr:hypothetical protein [Proteus mirabilis]MDK6999236.1 hypothetical protein [Proteus mirabilis]MDK7017184.1 hypothetical protein [Proteus mirabilis]MDK8619003.1 hypothetical protein [Proteus mirabilis]
MDITFFCSDISCSSGVEVICVVVTDVTDISIPEKHQNEVLRTAISRQNIIKHLEQEGYTVTKG